MTKCNNCEKEATTREGLCKSCYGKAYRAANKEKLRIQKNEYNAANREAVNKNKNEWKKKNRKGSPKQYAAGGPCKVPGCTNEATTLDGICTPCYQKKYREENKAAISAQRKVQELQQFQTY